MLRDVFYYGKKPNVHPKEKFATSLEDARKQSTTEHFWIINEYCDYRGFDWDFDFEFLPDEDVWAEEHINVWPSQHQKDSGTWLCNTDNDEPLIIYRADVDVVKRKNIKSEYWVELDTVDSNKFDFSWHPDPTDPPYVYKWGSKFAPVQLKTCLEYHTPGATQIKYMDQIVELLPTDNWVEVQQIDKDKFDMSWRPDPMDPPMIYVWGNKYFPAETSPTLEYHVPGGTERKFMPEKLVLLTNMNNWELLESVDKNSFDFAWIPDPTSPPYIYVWGNQWNKPEDKISIQYIVEGATEYKYMEARATRKPSMDNWIVPKNIDATTFDFSWEPSPKEPPFIYQFGTQHQKTGGPQYVVEGATDIKYVEENRATATLISMKHWEIPEGLDISEFDFTWHPDATEKPYIYVFGTQWALTGGPKYISLGATEVKYVDSPIAKAAPNRQHWIIPNGIAVEEFDFSWHPYIEDQPYIYQFGTQHQKTGGPQYITPGSDEMSPIKYVDTRILKARHLKSKESFSIVGDIKIKDFDYSWHPDSTEQPFIYVFGNQWHPAELEPTIEYRVPGATTKKYINNVVAIAGADMNLWDVPEGFNKDTFDFSWRPNPTSPPYIYQFGSLLDKDDGPRYITPENDGEVVYLERKEIVVQPTTIEFPKYYVETTLEDLIKKHPNEIFWALNPELDYSSFDFEWRPTIEQAQYVHAFGSSESETTQTYLVNSNMWEKGFRELNWVQDEQLDEQTLSKLFKKPDMFFVDRGNKEAQERFDKLKQQFPTIQKTRYLNTWVDTINRCINRATTNLCWILNSELDYSNFNFDYYPNPWQMKMIQVFGTQWSHWGTTFMVNRDTFANDTKYVKVIEHLNNLNFVKDRRAISTNVLYDKIYIDHGNKPIPADALVIQYEESYLNTFKKLLDKLPEKKEHFVWVTSSICDYTGFDFTYICDPFAREQLHVFPSDKQKFGDTFLINVNKLRELISEMNVLEDYNKVNYNQHQRAKRLPSPIIITEGDTHVSSIDTNFDFPYATFVTIDNKDTQVIDSEPMSIWDAESKTIQVTSVGGTRIVVPKEIKKHFKRELYDYPYISTNSKLAKSTPMDIVFLSNGETGADENYDHLIKTTQGLPNRVVRVDGVNGRVQAYHAAAEASNTPWMFTVFAKLKVSNKFDWNWQPDRLQIPKHYVFHAKNPVNGLVYGHMAMIAYNKKLTLANKGKGLDFTMDDEHEVLEINSGTANFNTDEWSTWRTSFREALKLRANEDQVSKDRLDIWLTVGMSKFNEYSMEGAQHAVEYYEEVNGDFDKLKLSYDWPWLRAYFDKKYK